MNINNLLLYIYNYNIIAIMRFVLVMLLNLFMTLIQMSPNFGSETINNLKSPEDGKIPNYYGIFAVYMTMFNLSSIYHLYYHLNDPLTFVEYCIFFLAVIGLILRLWCYYILHKYFTYNLCIKNDHKLIKIGPYKYLIHPSYTGQVLLTLMALFFIRNYPLFGFVLLYAAVRLNQRVLAEENMMREHFGQEYDDYVGVRWRFVPFVY